MFQGGLYGLEIGGSSVKAVKIRTSGDKVVLERAVKIPVPESDAETGIVQQQTAVALKSRIEDTQLGMSTTVLGISGRDAIMRYSQVPPVQPWRRKMIMEYQVQEMAGKQGDDVASDYRILDLPRSHLDEFMVMVALARNEFIVQRLDTCLQANVKVHSACPNSIALYNTFLAAGPDEADRTYFIADVGASHTDVIIVRNGALLFARTVSVGGNAFTKALQDELMMTPEVAEKAKVEEGVIKDGGYVTEREERISRALTRVAEQFTNMVNSSLQFARIQTHIKDLEVDQVLLVGGGTGIKGLPAWMSKTLEKPVDAWNLAASVTVAMPAEEQAEFSSRMNELACPIGLALAQAGGRYVSMDLLPEAFRKEREFREQTRYLYVAGVLMLLLLLSVFSLLFHKSSTVSSVKAKLDEVKSEIEARERENEKTKSDIVNYMSIMGKFARETRPGYFFVRLLNRLRKITPNQVTVLEAKTDWNGDERGKDPDNFRVVLKIRVYSPSGREYEHLNKFTATLENEPYVSSVSPVDLGRGKAKGLMYQLTITPVKEIKRAENVGRQP